MGQTAVAFSPNVRAKRPEFSLDKNIRDALAEHFRREYPANATKLLARDFALSTDEARAVLEARCSLNSLNQILKSKNGGWSVLLPVMGVVIGETLDRHLENQRHRHDQQAERHRALGRHLRANAADVLGLGDGARSSDN